MAVSPVNVTRVSQNLRSFQMLNLVRNTQVGLFRSQTELATGLRFQTPSEDPTRAAQAIRLDRRQDVLRQVANNLRETTATAAATEATMQEAIDIVREAHELALQTATDTLSAAEREALSVVADGLLDRLISIGNREHLGSYLFSGYASDRSPFELTGEGVLFHGDDGRMHAIVDSDLSEDDYTISGQQFFNAVSAGVKGMVDLDPAVTADTRIVDLNGATGDGVDLGRILVELDAEQIEVDLSSADTVGDVIDMLNAALPDSLTASTNGQALAIVSDQRDGPDLRITDSGGGTGAVDLGIATTEPVPTNPGHVGADLDPRLTPRTSLANLNAGAGIDLSDGLRIRVGESEALIDFATAETIEDVLSRINQSNIGVMARLSADGQTIEVLNRVSGADLHIEENGGSAADALGIRTMHRETPLAGLNNGLGVDSVDGDDFRITTANGTQIEIDINELDLDTATLGDAVDLLQKYGGAAITAALAENGNGIVITDNTVGLGALRIERLNVSPTIDSLGLDVQPAGNVIEGADVNPLRVKSAFTALVDLRSALTQSDTPAVTKAGQLLEETLGRMQEVQGMMAAKARTLELREERIANEQVSTEVLQGEVRDADMTESIVRFQQLQTALQANLQTTAKILGLSLLNYLR